MTAIPSEAAPPGTRSQPFSVGIVGASGFTGTELLRLLAAHPGMQIKVATGSSKADSRVSDLYPSLAAAYPNLTYSAYDAAGLDGLDLVFFGLPHGISQTIIPELRGRVGHMVDLGSDFRLHDASLYPEWYGADHVHPELLDDFVYGLPEFFRTEIQGAELIAATGCNAAASIFALAPLLHAGLIEPDGLIADIVTGVSGAGRPPKENTTFCAVDSDITAYGLLRHRHTPEIEQALCDYTGLTTSVLFTPHLAPLNRGIIATCYGRPTRAGITTADALEALHAIYDDEPFVVVQDISPSVKATLGANTVHVTARADPRTGLVMAIAVLDNLMKGASGMAMQNANLALGLEETLGLPIVGVYP